MSNNQNGQQSNNSSKLNLTNSEQFRGFLLSKNLRPYSQLGNSGVDNSTRYFETVLSNLVPKRTESLLDIGKEYYEKLTSNNPFGKIEKIDSAEAINTLDGPVSVDQIGNGKTEEYTSANSKLELVNEFFIDVAAIVNRYKPEGGFKESYLSSDNIVPKYVGSSQMYPNYSIIQKNITSFAQKDGTLNKYIPLEGYIGPYTLEDNLPNLEGGDIGSYPNFSKINNRNWIEYQKVIASINQYIPENGYVNEISLNVNVKPKNSEGGNEYRSSTLSEKDILEKIKEESIINRYQPKNGLFNAYSNRLVSLPKLSNGTDEYTNQSNNLDNYTYANQTAAAAINKFIPQNGYNEEVFLKLNSLIKTNKDIGGYSSSSRSNEDIIKKVKDEVTINRYQPENGMYNIYENSIYTLNKLRGGSKAYSNSSEILKQNSTNPQKEAASINKFKPIGGYSNEISMGLYTLPVGSGRFDEYIASALEDEQIIKKTKESTLVNKYQPFGGEYNKYTYVFNTLSKPNGGSSEYTSSSNIIGELNLENQIFALTSNKYAPQAGSNLPINVNSISLINESERQTEYPSNLRPINEIPQKVLSDVSLNRYMALEGNLNSYSNRTTILPKITNGAQEYTNSDLFSLMINKKSRDESASINKFRPIDGYNYEISFSIQTIKNGDNINSEYFASTKDEQDFLKNTSEETRLNRYQPQQGLFSLYSINLNSLTKLEGGSQEYNIDTNSLVIFNKLNQTEAGLTNKYAPQNGFINFAEINTFVVPRGDYAQVEYPNNLKPDSELEKETKIGLSLNRYIATNGQLDFYSQTIKILPKVNSGAEQYKNSEIFITNASNSALDSAAGINKFYPNGGYNYTVELKLNTIKKGDYTKSEYDSSLFSENDILESTKEETVINKYQPTDGLYVIYSNTTNSLKKNKGGSQEYNIDVNSLINYNKDNQLFASKFNKYLPPNGYKNEIGVILNSLPKELSSVNQYPSQLRLDTELTEDAKSEIAVNRYVATNGSLSVYSQNTNFLSKLNGSIQEYGINSNSILLINSNIQKEFAKSNRYIPNGGYSEIKLDSVSLSKNDSDTFEYPNNVAEEEELFENVKKEIAINRYQPAGFFESYSNSVNALPKLAGTSQEYRTDSNLFLFINEESRTIASTNNRYSPDNGYNFQIEINSFSLSKNQSATKEYPNSILTDNYFVEEAKKLVANNRYTANNAELGVFLQNVNLLKRGAGSLEYVNSDFYLDNISEKNLVGSAAINKYSPQEGYNLESQLNLFTLIKEVGVNEYSLNVDLITGVATSEQTIAGAVNKFIPQDGYNFQYSNTDNILPKGGPVSTYPSQEELIPEISSEIKQTEVINKYIPDSGFVLTYVPNLYVLNRNNYPTKEYPNFIIPDSVLYENNTVNISALLNGQTNSLINPQESYLQQLSVRYLAESFQERIDNEIQRQTIGRVNLQAFSDPFSLSLLGTGQQTLIAKNYTITVPDGIFDQAAYLIQRFSGTYIPVSPIEGEYFTNYPSKEKTKIGGLIQNVLSLFTKPATSSNRSTKFLNNTGSGQKKVLFSNLENNIYRPMYDSNTSQVGTAVDNFLDLIGNPLGLGDNSIGNLYIPNDTEDIQNLTNPITVDNLGKVFEGPDLDNFNFGLKSKNYNEDRDPTGGFSWTQGSTIDLAGKQLGSDGLQGPQNPVFQGNVQDKLNSSRSDNLVFRDSSILKKTQDLVNDTPNSGPKRYLHVGNAISQISKVFNDGYKEMTKGSKVKKYVTKNGAEVGEEYGRVFTKDVPYLTFNNLQSTVANTSGLETNGNIRKFTNSVLDSTYNLNIAPTYGQDSTSIKNAKVKKYMFSIENLAWRNTDEYNSLPDCEKGPNGGRIMWFPPYGLEVGTESSSPTFNSTNFLGRPEPIYTYENTKRSGSVTWQIIVDHPSVSDIVVKYELAKTDGNLATQVMNSFFAGLKKYDIYELAKKYNTVSLTTLENIYQNVLSSNQTSDEQKQEVFNQLGPESSELPTSNAPTDLSANFVGNNFYFPVELTSNEISYDDISFTYTGEEDLYIDKDLNNSPSVETFFGEYLSANIQAVESLRDAVAEILGGGNEVVQIFLQKTKLLGTAENQNIWFDSIVKFFESYEISDGKKIGDYIDKTFIITELSGEESIVTPKDTQRIGGQVDCSVIPPNTPNVSYSFNAAACRGYIIKKITITPNLNKDIPTQDNENSLPKPQVLQGLKPQPSINIGNDATGISKKIIRELLTEANYFEVLKKDQSFIFDSIKDKFKFFNPLFHSITPEGLNSRLVFLQQCVRPGKTIPVKQEDGTSINTDSYNTNFGTPPILILRIGDFFHTKIVPTQLSISYEQLWDYNPEGIGFQPMIAKVTLGYDMIGGQGLAGPVEQLQNALSFNYYANTEIYDERAVATEDTTAIDTALLNSIRNNEPLGPINSSEDVANDLGETIGELISSTPFSGGVQTGVLQYKKIFNEFIDNTRNYFQESLNVYDTVLNQFNKGIWSQFVNQRNFYNGSFQNLQTPISATLIGKPVYYQNVINSLAEDYANKFETQDTLAIGLNNLFTGGTFSELTYNKIINNYSNLITSTAESNFSSLATIAQDISDVQSKLTIMIEKLDFISFSGDAKVLKDNSAKFYFLTGQTNSLTKFKEDYSIVVNSITAFTNAISGTLIIPSNLVSGTFTNFIPINNTQFQNLDSYAFTLFSDKILDETKLQDFLTSLTNGLDETEVSVAKDSIKNIIDNKWKTLFSDEKNAEKTEFENLKNTTVIKDCVNFNPTSNGVSLSTDERKMDFSTSGNDSAYTTPFDNIRSTQNTNNDPISYNGKKQYNG